MAILHQLMLLDEELSTKLFFHANENNYRKYVKAWATTCDGIFWFTIPVIMSFYYYYFRHKVEIAQKIWVFWGGLVLTALVATLIKALIKRPRPKINPKDRLFIGPDIHSFPSGHTSRAFYITTFSFFINPLLGIIVLLWAIGVGYARIALGRHYPSDVIGGILNGTIIALIINLTPLSEIMLGPSIFEKFL